MMRVQVWIDLPRDKVAANEALDASQDKLDESLGLLYVFSDQVALNEKRIRDIHGDDTEVFHRFQKEYPIDMRLISWAIVPSPSKKDKE